MRRHAALTTTDLILRVLLYKIAYIFQNCRQTARVRQYHDTDYKHQKPQYGHADIRACKVFQIYIIATTMENTITSSNPIVGNAKSI